MIILSVMGKPSGLLSINRKSKMNFVGRLDLGEAEGAAAEGAILGGECESTEATQDSPSSPQEGIHKSTTNNSSNNDINVPRKSVGVLHFQVQPGTAVNYCKGIGGDVHDKIYGPLDPRQIQRQTTPQPWGLETVCTLDVNGDGIPDHVVIRTSNSGEATENAEITEAFLDLHPINQAKISKPPVIKLPPSNVQRQ